MRVAFIAFCVFVSVAGGAGAETLKLDAPLPPDMQDRTYLPSAAVAGVRKNMEKVVGYFAFVKGGKITVTASKPASLSAAALARVQITGDKPSYESIVSNASSINAALPMIGLTLAANQRAQITITETAQFTSTGDPGADDWKNLPAVINGGHWAYVSSATVSTVSVTTLEEKTGALDVLLSALKIGAKTYQAKSVASNTLAVALFLTPDPTWVAQGGDASPPKGKSTIADAVATTTRPLGTLATQQ